MTAAVARKRKGRTDVHRPSALVTEDYEYVFAEVNHIEGAPGWVLRLGDFGLEMARWIGRTDKLQRSTNQCHHCGAHLNYFAVLRHLPTGDAIVVGETCLEGRFDLATAEFHRLRKAAELDRQKMRIKGLRAEFVKNNPDLAFMDEQPLEEMANEFIRDVAAKLRRYGELSQKQVDAVRRAVVRDAKWAERRAKEPQPVRIPETGRVVVRGVVLSTRWEETDGYWMDSRKKALLACPHSGGIYKIWTTIPSKIAGDVEKGDELALRGNVTRSENESDGSFGFMKRPYLVEHLDEDGMPPCGDRMDHVFWRCDCERETPVVDPAPNGRELSAAVIESLATGLGTVELPPCGNVRDHEQMDCDCPDDEFEPVAMPPCGDPRAHADWDCDCPDEVFETEAQAS